VLQDLFNGGRCAGATARGATRYAITPPSTRFPRDVPASPATSPGRSPFASPAADYISGQAIHVNGGWFFGS